MALPITSNTAAFLVSRDDIISVALENLKVIATGETPNSSDVTLCARRLNMILKFLNTKGWLQWCYTTNFVAFQAGKASYTIAESGGPDLTGYRPVRIARVWRRDTTTTPPIDTQMFPLSRDDYGALSIKTQPGLPNQWYYDPQIGLSQITVWPVPTDATNSLYITLQRPIQDITSSGQNFDLEQEWFLPLGWILSDEVSGAFEVSDKDIAICNQKATFYREEIANFSQEQMGFSTQPDQQMANMSNRFSM